MERQKALRIHQKDLHLCSEDEWKSYSFGTTWGRVINVRIKIFGWTNPLTVLHINTYQKKKKWCALIIFNQNAFPSLSSLMMRLLLRNHPTNSPQTKSDPTLHFFLFQKSFHLDIQYVKIGKKIPITTSIKSIKCELESL